MHIIAHLGSTDNEYLLAIATFRPSRCPACGHGSVHYHDRFSRQGREQQVPILRFRCGRGRCQQVFSVLPSYLPPRQSYSAAVEETVVATYASGAAPLATVAAAAGIGTTTAFRWVDRACSQISAWLAVLQRALLLLSPAADLALRLQEKFRRLWRLRRIRKPGKVDQLLLLEQWPPWVQRLRQVLTETFGSEPAPGWAGPLAFWRLHGSGLQQMVSTTEGGKARSPQRW